MIALTLLLAAGWLLYAKSKYYPGPWRPLGLRLRGRAGAVRLFAYALCLLALYPLVQQWGWLTGVVVWLMAILLLLSLLVTALPLYYHDK